MLEPKLSRAPDYFIRHNPWSGVVGSKVTVSGGRLLLLVSPHPSLILPLPHPQEVKRDLHPSDPRSPRGLVFWASTGGWGGMPCNPHLQLGPGLLPTRAGLVQGLSGPCPDSSLPLAPIRHHSPWAQDQRLQMEQFIVYFGSKPFKPNYFQKKEDSMCYSAGLVSDVDPEPLLVVRSHPS